MKTKQPNNRPKSKNNPNGKAKEAKVDWPKYNRRRNAVGPNRDRRLSTIADKARELPGMGGGVQDRRVSAVPASITKPEIRGSYRELANHLQKHPGRPGRSAR